MSQCRLEYAWRTDKGKVRGRNEDAVSVFPDIGLVIVADGIGGASAGEVASRLATHTIGERFRGQPTHPSGGRKVALNLAKEAVAEANRTIWESAQRSSRYTGMGTTVVMGYVGPGWLVYAHVGDSRLYRLRDGELLQLTRDHSLLQEVVDQGFFPSMEDALRYGINGHILTRGLGNVSPVKVDAGNVDLLPGDLFLFCTDGLTGMLTDDGLRRALLRREKSLENLAVSLVALANEGGGLDNITLALVRIY